MMAVALGCDVPNEGATSVLADSYPAGGIFLTMLWFFLFVIWIWILITIFADIFRRHDISGWIKALWIIFVIILPYLGVLIYLIAEHKGMAERSLQQAQQQKADFDSYVQSVATPGGGAATEIANAQALLDKGSITQDEFDKLKAKALGTA
jgi:type IV secretory pathway TrbL component